MCRSAPTGSALLAACRANDTTIHGALAAALLFAIADEFDQVKSRYLGVNSLVDLRGGLEGGLTERDLGLYISTVTTVHQLDSQRDFWSLAREVPHYLKRIMNSGDANIVNSIYPEIPLYTPDERGARRLQKIIAMAPPSSMLTNIGRVDVLDLGKALRISALSFAVSPPAQHPVCMTTASYSGRIHSNLLYDQCKMKRDQAGRIKDHIQHSLQQAAHQVGN